MQEVHMFPGLSLLTQCATSLHNKGLGFHMSKEYYWKIDKEKVSITSVGSEPFPFVNFVLPFALVPDTKCDCGIIGYKKLC